ncbi:MAG: winged helix DNA-binding protein [Saprospiraceae bacterium]|nr:winged helix DNA-binding protein [Saprospiraceae bacterium]
MQAKFLHQLLDLAHAYEQAGGDTAILDREDFLSWAFGAYLSNEKTAQPAERSGPSPNGLIAMYLSFMARYAQYYSRRVFRDSAVYSEDDWGVLVSLYPYKRLSKTEVMRGCIMEKSSGNEVLKRLLRDGHLREQPHPDDKRSKLIELTDQGRSAFESLQNGITKLADTVVADLNEDEKNTLLQLLLKLHRFHKAIFEEADEQTLHQMLR